MKTKNSLPVMFQQLEPRQLLSAAPVSPHLTTATNHPAITLHARTFGEVLHLTAGSAFTGTVAFFVPATSAASAQYSASIDWGDGSTSAGTITTATRGHLTGYDINGMHTYANAGKFKIITTIAQGVVGSPATPLLFVARVVAHAVVAPNNGPSSGGGVTLNEVAGNSFTARVGTFQTIAPGTKLKASINWGDGSVSDGTITPTGVIGIDVISFEVTGTHTYAQAGNYAIHATITRTLSVSAAANTVATIDSAAIVVATKTVPIAGTLTGTYTTSLVSLPDVGHTYSLAGTGTAGSLGSVTANGTLSTPGLILWAGPRGTITLANANGTVTLSLAVSDPVPVASATDVPTGAYIYSVTNATGAYLGNTASGLASLVLAPSTTAVATGTFTLLLM